MSRSVAAAAAAAADLEQSHWRIVSAVLRIVPDALEGPGWGDGVYEQAPVCSEHM